jgi:hypothetical protein
MSALTSCARAVIEGMSDSGSSSKRDVYAETLSVLLAFIFALIILSFIGKLLWNSVVVDLFSFAKPAKSFMHIVGLMIFANLIRP